MTFLALAALRALPFLLSPPRNRGLPRLRIIFSRKSGRPDLRWGRAGERGGCKFGARGLPLSLTLPHKGGGNGSSIVRFVLLAAALLTVSGAAALAQSRDDLAAVQALRANVTVTGNVVRIGDVIDNAGTSARSRSTAPPISAPPARCRWTNCSPRCRRIR